MPDTPPVNRPGRDDTGPLPASLEDLKRVEVPIGSTGSTAGRLVATAAPGPDRNCLSYWFPRLLAAGVPVPKTEIVLTEPDLPGHALLALCDGGTPDGFTPFLARLDAARLRVAGPDAAAFLRTGHTAGKHDWRNTCYVPTPADLSRLARRVTGLVNYSAMAGAFGLPIGVWAVRELLPTRPLCYLAKYGHLPLVPELRAFVEAGQVVCVHPYWPGSAIRKGMDQHQLSVLDSTPVLSLDMLVQAAGSVGAEDVPAVWLILQKVATRFAGDGAWSVDLIDTDRGWYVTDCAEAHRSYHYYGCPNAGRLSAAGGQ